MNLPSQLGFFTELSSTSKLKSLAPPNPIRDSFESVFSLPSLSSYYLLDEDGNYILQEDGAKIKLEESPV
jgi:hypothetical protein